MKLPRRQFLHLAAGAAALPALRRVARAQTYPARPVRIIVPFAAGGGTDITARIIGQWLSERLGQQFIIENRPGGGTNIGTEVAARAPADGYTLLMVGTSNTTNPSLYDKLNFDLLRDFAAVAGVIRAPHIVVVNLSLPVTTFPEFIAYAKANPGKVSMASAGSGSPPHLAGELFKVMTKVNMTHVPYRGGGPAVSDLLGGQVQVYFGSFSLVIEHIRAGKLRALAVTTPARFESLPDIPTVGEFVPDYVASQWFAMGLRKNTPAEIIGRLNKEVDAVLTDAKIQARLADLGTTMFRGSPAELGIFIVEETEKWAKVVRFAGIKPE